MRAHYVPVAMTPATSCATRSGVRWRCASSRSHRGLGHLVASADAHRWLPFRNLVFGRLYVIVTVLGPRHLAPRIDHSRLLREV